MAEKLLVLGDCGGTNTNIMVFNQDGHPYAHASFSTNVHDYEGMVQKIGDTAEVVTKERGEIVAASVAVAASSNKKGVLVQSGTLSPWIGNNMAADIATVLNISGERVG